MPLWGSSTKLYTPSENQSGSTGHSFPSCPAELLPTFLSGIKKEGVVIDLISILDQGRVHLGGHLAGADEVIHLPGREDQSTALLTNIYGRFRRGLTIASSHAYAMDFRTQSLLQALPPP